MALRLEEVCPKCGSHLMIKEGENGDFLACPRFPVCRFTKPLTESYFKDNVLQGVYQKPSSYCEKCNHTGLIPFKNGEGKVIPHTFLYCECHPSYGSNPEPEHYHSPAPEDFDFPMSYSYYRSLCQYQGWPDPGSCESPEHDTEELHERIMALEEKPNMACATPQQRPGGTTQPTKTESKLHGGVQL